MVGLLGQRDELLRLIEEAFDGSRIVVRGNEITIDGEDAERVGRLFDELVMLLEQGQRLDAGDVGRTITMVKDDVSPAEVLTTELLRSARGRTVRPKTAGQKRYTDAIATNVVTFGIGPAGTGKSYLAVALAVQALQARDADRIILTRPAVEAGERLGFLPGDIMAKVDPYLRPLYDALYDLLGPEGAQRLLERGTIEVAPLAFMRGRTLNRSFIILDEAQNTTPEQMKMFLTRIGFGSKVVVTGDVTQIDVAGGRSGLPGLEAVLGSVPGLAFVHLTQRDVVRARIVADIVSAYERADEANGAGAGRARSGAVVAEQAARRARARAEPGGPPVVVDVFAADEQSERDIDIGRWVKLARDVLDAQGVKEDVEVSLLFVDEPTIAELHERFLGEPGPTDVLAFPIDEEPELGGRSPDEGGTGPGGGLPSDESDVPTLLGDVVVCPSVAARNAVDARREPRGRGGAAGRARPVAPARDGPRRRRRGRDDGATRAGVAGPLPPGRSVAGTPCPRPCSPRGTSGRPTRFSSWSWWCCWWGRASWPWPRRPCRAPARPRRCRCATSAGADRAGWCDSSSTPRRS